MAGKREQNKVTKCFTKNLLTILTITGVVAGVVLGLILKASKPIWTPREVMYVQFGGFIFLQMLKCMIIPLLVSSIITAIGSLDFSLSKKIGFRAIAYYCTTTCLAVVQGIILVTVIRPGGGDASQGIKRTGTSRNVTTVDTLLDLARNLFPDNIISACVSQTRTTLKFDPTSDKMNISDLYTWEIGSEPSHGSNVLGLVMFAIILGIAIGKMGEVGKPLLRFFDSLGEAVMVITNWVIWLSPVGILFLVSSKILEMESIAVVIGQLGWYFFTVLLGLAIHGLIVIPGIYMLGTRKLPFKFLANMTQAHVTAFGTGSSSATLPISLQCLEEKNKCDPRVSRFVMPIGATINMDGTALYEAVAAIFIAQLRNVPLSFGNIVAISVTATMASIGAAGIPQAGLVTMVMVLDTVGLPAEDVTLIIAVDWLLDRFRTLINVMSDGLGAGLVEHLSKDELRAMDDVDQQKGNIRKMSLAQNAQETEWLNSAL